MSAKPDLGEIACNGTDRQWYNLTWCCGGCGSDACHRGAPCTPGEEGCRYCPDRGGTLTPPVRVREIPNPDQGVLFGGAL